MGKNHKPKDADEYVSKLDKDTQTRLNELRKTVKSALPKDAEETIRWGMPTYRYGGKNLASFAVFTRHTGLFVGAEVIEALGRELDGYTTSKAVIHLPHGRPLSLPLVKSAVKKSLEFSGLK